MSTTRRPDSGTGAVGSNSMRGITISALPKGLSLRQTPAACKYRPQPVMSRLHRIMHPCIGQRLRVVRICTARRDNMFVSMIIVFREAMEAGLIVGIVLAATKGVAGRATWISGGIAAGVAGASLVA